MKPSASGSRAAREQRLLEIRREAETRALTQPHGNRHTQPSLQASSENGYYGTPLLKPPQWTVEVPLYFFVGGAAGAAAVIAAVGSLSPANDELVRDAQWLAAIGGAVSPALLVADLGLPSRFLNMLRVFKVLSPMSVGSWTLVVFSSSAAAAAVLGELQYRRGRRPVTVITSAAQIVAALSGLILSTYTGVLLGATAIPVWHEHVASLPIHFAASGVSTAVSMLELKGHDSEALNKIAIGAAAIETAIGASVEQSTTPATKALRSGATGWAMRGAGLLSGPVPLALRLMAVASKSRNPQFRRAAAVCSIAGSLLTRFAWISAGRASASDPSVPLRLTKSSPATGRRIASP